MSQISERRVWHVNGWAMVLAELLLVAGCVQLVLSGIRTSTPHTVPVALLWAVPLVILFMVVIQGFFLIHPNEAKVFVFLGRYIGSARNAGFHWANPFALRKKITLRMLNFNSETLKVNDALGNPIEIAAVVVWNVFDSAKALFDVENYNHFVAIQSETAIRTLANHYPYDAHEKDHESLRGNPDAVAGELRKQVQERLQVAGVSVVEARLTHLAYAPEIAQTMLRRQQAAAIIAARRLIVDGAVGMVEMALTSLEQQGVIRLDEERKAAMVNNLLVALVSESQAQPVINTGTLYS